ncbi:MAG TPA: sulfonate ABC transporter ATP-binding protein, partial [Cupriavidus sp.]|nr:sulfonate ABC transporter ATP-binding protein [Cupriavidus sp.]
MAEGNSAHLRVVASHEPLLQVDGVSLEYRKIGRAH